MDNLTREQRHKNMCTIKSRDTSIELILRKALWRNGIRYRKNYRILPENQILLLQDIRLLFFVIVIFGMVVVGKIGRIKFNILPLMENLVIERTVNFNYIL